MNLNDISKKDVAGSTEKDTAGAPEKGVECASEKDTKDTLGSSVADRLKAIVSGEFDEEEVPAQDATFIVDETPWQGGRVSNLVTCLRADNPSPMTYVGTNTWIVANPEKVQGEDTQSIVIDPSPEGDQTQRILDTCVEMGVKVGAIILTHDHHDHTAGARELADKTGAPIYGPKEEMGADAPCGPFKVDHLLQEGLLYPFEGAPIFEVYKLPGHSSDSMGLLLSEEQLMFVGDVVFRHGPTVVFYPDGHLGDYLASLDLLEDLVKLGKVCIFCPGHGYPVTDPMRALEATREHRLERLDQVKEALASGVSRDADALFDAVYEGVDESLRWASLRSIEAQLVYLAAQDN